MTKYEWESELKRNIHRMPEDEIKKVVEYYNELFEDKIERGLDERDIIAEFGNPVDVADKILAEHGEIGKEDNIAATPKATISENGATKAQKAISNTDIIAPTVAIAEAKPQVKATAQPSSKSCGKFSGSRLAIFIVFAVVLGGVFFGVAVAVWSCVVAIIASGGAFLVVGIVWIVPTFSLFAGGFAPALVQLGCCLLLSGLGALLIIAGVKLIKLCARVTKASFRGMKNFLVVKRSEAYEN